MERSQQDVGSPLAVHAFLSFFFFFFERLNVLNFLMSKNVLNISLKEFVCESININLSFNLAGGFLFLGGRPKK